MFGWFYKLFATNRSKSQSGISITIIVRNKVSEVSYWRTCMLANTLILRIRSRFQGKWMIGIEMLL